MDAFVEKLISNLITAAGISQISQYKGIIFATILVIYFLMDKNYKQNNAKFYNVSEKYFIYNTFREFIVNSILIILILLSLGYMFIESFGQNNEIYLVNFALLVLYCMFLIYSFLQKLYNNNLYIFKSDNSGKSKTRDITLIATLLLIPLCIYYYFRDTNLNIQEAVSYLLLGLTILYIIFISLVFASKKCKKICRMMNNTIVKSVFYMYQIIYFSILSIVFITVLSSLTLSDKIIVSLAQKNSIYMEKTNTDKKDDNDDNDVQAELNSISEYILKEVKDGNKLSSSAWFEAFNNPETLIKPYSEDKKGADSGIAIKFIDNLEKSNKKNELFSAIKLLLFLQLITNSIIIFITVLAGLIFVVTYMFVVKDKYLNPSRKKRYEYIVDSSGLREFIITDYNDKLLVMTEQKGNNDKSNLMLDSSSYKLISLTSDDIIFQERYDQVNIYGAVADEKSNTIITPDEQYEKSILRDPSNQIGCDKEYKPVTFDFDGGTKDGKVVENVTKEVLIGAKLSDAVETIDTIGVFKTIGNSLKGFKKWTSAKNSSVEYEDVVIEDDYKPITLYAQYNKKLVKDVNNDKETPDDGYKFVIFDFNGGTKDGEELEIVKKEILIGAKLSDAVASVKTFGSFKNIGSSLKGFSVWTDIKDDVEEYDDVIIDDKYETKTLYAYYDKEVVRDVDRNKYF